MHFIKETPRLPVFPYTILARMWEEMLSLVKSKHSPQCKAITGGREWARNVTVIPLGPQDHPLQFILIPSLIPYIGSQTMTLNQIHNHMITSRANDRKQNGDNGNDEGSTIQGRQWTMSTMYFVCPLMVGRGILI